LALAVFPSLSRAALHIAHCAFAAIEKKIESKSAIKFLEILF
jgi:hypothetical protein